MEKLPKGIKLTETEKFVPEKLAQRCPVCNGFGTLKYGEKVCQACEGKGYVLVPAVRVDCSEHQVAGGVVKDWRGSTDEF